MEKEYQEQDRQRNTLPSPSTTISTPLAPAQLHSSLFPPILSTIGPEANSERAAFYDTYQKKNSNNPLKQSKKPKEWKKGLPSVTGDSWEG